MKIHLACDALGNSLRFILSGGEVSDHRQAENLIADFQFDYLIADKGDDTFICRNDPTQRCKRADSVASMKSFSTKS